LQAEGDRLAEQHSAAHKKIEATFPAHPLIRLAELRKHKDFGCVDQRSRKLGWGGGQIPSHVIESTIAQTAMSGAMPFEVRPLAVEGEYYLRMVKQISDAEKTVTIERLGKRLLLARTREAKLKQRFAALKHLEKAAQRCWSQCTDIEDKIAKIPAKTPDDLAAKLALYRKMEPDEQPPEIMASFITDATRALKSAKLIGGVS
jgi:hypothetical protein